METLPEDISAIDYDGGDMENKTKTETTTTKRLSGHVDIPPKNIFGIELFSRVKAGFHLLQKINIYLVDDHFE